MMEGICFVMSNRPNAQRDDDDNDEIFLTEITIDYLAHLMHFTYKGH
jgi:hypothetical protein